MAVEYAAPAQQQPEDEVDQDQGNRMDVPGVIDEQLIVGSVGHVQDERLLKHLHVTYVLDAENPRKRSEDLQLADPLVERGRIELDDDYTYETFKENVKKATEMITNASANGNTVFVFCTHGNNESTIVCMTYLMLAKKWTLERAYKHVLQKRPASAPRRAYIEKLRFLERETHGHVTLRSAQVPPSMMDLMLGLRGESRPEDADEVGSQVTEPESVDTTVERASIMSNFSMTTGLHNGSSLRETMIIAERDEEYETSATTGTELASTAGRNRHKKDCIIM